RVYEDSDISMLITMEYDSHSNSLFIGDRPQGFRNGCLKRMNLESGEVEVLLDEDEYVIYDTALHPSFSANGYIYLGRNGPGSVPRHQRSSEVVRYTVNPASGEFDPDSLLKIIGWTSGGHDGAAVEFGDEGLLFITSGDGTNDSDTDNQGQGLDHLRAKVLRINVDKPGKSAPYSVPPDNPFVDMSGARPETWAYGFRNPWRMTYDAKSKQLWVGNNGQDWLEQVYLVERGANYGWSIFEGSKEFRPNRKRGPTPISGPTLEHHHQESRSLTGGVVYRGSNLEKIDGAYIYGDHSTGKIWGAKHDGEKVTWNEEIADTTLAITDFEQLPDGQLLVADHRAKGGIYKLVPKNAEDTSAAFPRKLSETGLFDSIADHKVKATLLPYSVNSPHWMDGAEAERFLILPEQAGDRPLGFHMLNTWNLPSRSAFMQTLTVRGKRIETRILAQHDNEWAGYTYRWNDTQTDAELVAAEGVTEPMDGGAPWRFPSRAECMTCHTRAAGFVLGFRTAQLNREHDYDGFTANQLDVFERLGWLRTSWGTDTFTAEKQNIAIRSARAREARDFELVDQLNEERRQKYGTRLQRGARGGSMLSHSPDRLPRMAHPADESADLETRARSYLATNCSHCHRGAGGGNSPFELTFGLDTDNLLVIDEPAVHGMPGMPSDAEIFVVSTDSKPAVLLTRVAIRGPGQMPPLCTNTPDTVGTAVLAKWLESLAKK
ncbi:MAG: PQQ-dependent sugar dehydrogenase, partial [Verrucomicrobiota bacterium]